MHRREREMSNTRLPTSRAPQAQLGYRPLVDFREGLRRTVAWYRSVAAVTARATRQ